MGRPECDVGVAGTVEVDALRVAEPVRRGWGGRSPGSANPFPVLDDGEFDGAGGPARLDGFEDGAEGGAQRFLDGAGNPVGMIAQTYGGGCRGRLRCWSGAGRGSLRWCRDGRFAGYVWLREDE